MEDITTATEQTHGAIDRAHETVERATETAHRAVDRASAGARHLTASGQQLADEVNAYVSAHPLQTLAAALVAGFILGRLTR